MEKNAKILEGLSLSINVNKGSFGFKCRREYSLRMNDLEKHNNNAYKTWYCIAVEQRFFLGWGTVGFFPFMLIVDTSKREGFQLTSNLPIP